MTRGMGVVVVNVKGAPVWGAVRCRTAGTGPVRGRPNSRGAAYVKQSSLAQSQRDTQGKVMEGKL